MDVPLEYIFNLEINLAFPAVILLLGIIFKLGIVESFTLAVKMGVGFIGIKIIFIMMMTTIYPLLQEITTNYFASIEVIDVGWPVAATISYFTQAGALIIPLAVIINIIMLELNLTKTINVDVWNFWHFAFTGSLAAALLGSVALGLLVAVIKIIIVLVLADIFASLFQKFYELPGISLPHGYSLIFLPLSLPFIKLFELLDFDFKISEEKLQKLQQRLNFLNEPLPLGIIIGFILGGLAGQDIFSIINIAIILAAILIIFPKMGKILMEALNPISDAIKDFLEERYEDQEILKGMDSAIAVGHSSVLTVTIFLIPLTIILALILPGNRVLPFGDLLTIPFLLVSVVPLTKGDFLQTLIIGLIFIVAGLYIATNLTPVHTQAALNAGMSVPAEMEITSLVDGANPLIWLLLKIADFTGLTGLIITGAAFLGLGYFKN